MFSIEFYKVSKCAIASANFQFEPPWGRPENFLSLHISIFRQYSTISPQFFLKILKNTVTISRYIVFLEHIKSHFLGWSVPRCHFYRPWNVSFKKERNFYLTFSFTKKNVNVGLKTAMFCKHSLMQCMSTPISWHLESRLPEVWWSISTSEVKPPVPQKYFQEFPIFQIKAKIATRKLRRWEEYVEVICALPRVENKEGGLIVNFEQKYKSFSFQIKTNANSKC